MRGPTRRCLVVNCHRTTSGARELCRTCWRALPDDVRVRVREAFADDDPSELYYAWCSAAELLAE